MPGIYSDLPQPVMQALLEQTGFELTDEQTADIKIYKSQLSPAPYRLGEIIDLINISLGVQLIKGITFNFNQKTAEYAGISANLTEKEAEIIRTLTIAKSPLSREELLQKIWQYAAGATTNTVETHIYRLRQKLTENFGIGVIDTIGGNYFIQNDR
jgi:hypothetical protein